MSDKKRHLNPLLLLIAILLCLSAGFLFRRTSFDANYKIPARHSSVIKKSKVTPTPVLTQKPKANVSISATPTITVEPSVSPSESISQDETSPEASLGVWTSSGSNWMFMVDGVPYTGWSILTANIISLIKMVSCRPDGWMIMANVITWIWMVSCRPERSQ